MKLNLIRILMKSQSENVRMLNDFYRCEKHLNVAKLQHPNDNISLDNFIFLKNYTKKSD